MSKPEKCEQEEHTCNDRRAIMKTAFGITATGLFSALSSAMPNTVFAAAITKNERDKMTPDEIIEGLKKGNERFREGKMKGLDYLAQKRASREAQYPVAIILSCIDSRSPAEIIFDTGIAETFNARVAGNVSNTDILGSIEYACAVAGAKVVVVMGHTSCGAVKGAIDNVKLGNLTTLLDEIKPAIESTPYSGERVGSNSDFVNEVAKTNVQRTLGQLRKGSSILSELEQVGKIKLIGAMYHLKGGKVVFLS